MLCHKIQDKSVLRKFLKSKKYLIIAIYVVILFVLLHCSDSSIFILHFTFHLLISRKRLCNPLLMNYLSSLCKRGLLLCKSFVATSYKVENDCRLIYFVLTFFSRLYLSLDFFVRWLFNSLFTGQACKKTIYFWKGCAKIIKHFYRLMLPIKLSLKPRRVPNEILLKKISSLLISIKRPYRTFGLMLLWHLFDVYDFYQHSS